MKFTAFSLPFVLGAAALAADPPAPTPGELHGHTALVYGVAFSPDGKQLATAGFDNLVKIWDPNGWKEVRTLTGHTGPVYCVAYSKDGATIATSSADKTIRLWKADDGSFLRDIKGHTDIVDCVAFSPDGKFVASGGGRDDKTVRLWNPADGKEMKNLGAHGGAVYAVAFSADGKFLASGGADMTIKIWDVMGQKELKTLKGPTGAVTALAYTADGTLLSVGQDRAFRVWDVNAGKEAKILQQTPDKQDDLYGLSVSPDGKSVATSGYSGWLTVWNLADGKPTWSKKLPAPCAFCCAFTPDGKSIVTGHEILPNLKNAPCYITALGAGSFQKSRSRVTAMRPPKQTSTSAPASRRRLW